MIFHQRSLWLLVSIISYSFFIAGCNADNSKSKEKGLQLNDSLSSNETANPYITLDQSPMDMSYAPPDYPILRMNRADSQTLMARVIYSRPQKKGRLIFGNNEKSLCQYGKDWRLGANEATEIEFFKPVIIAGKKVERGRYLIYCIPYPSKWTIILNNNLFAWGLHIDKSMDIFKTDIPATLQSPSVEDFTMVFVSTQYGADLIMTWDNVKAVLPVSSVK